VTEWRRDAVCVGVDEEGWLLFDAGPVYVVPDEDGLDDDDS
jgi:hypothetical protein